MREIHGDRIVLRTIGEDASEQVLVFVLRNKEFLREWEIQRDASYYTLEAQRRLIANDNQLMAGGQLFKAWIYKTGEPDRIIGSIALSNIVKGAFLSCTVGYRIDQNERNQGYMTEALRMIIRVAFDELRLHRIEANIMPRNRASLKVVEKLGFYNEGLATKYLKINGKWEDHIRMVLRNTELE